MIPRDDTFARMLSGPDADIDLARGALLIANDEYEGLDIAAQVARLDALAAGLKRRLHSDLGPARAIAALNRYLFDEHGFAGNCDDYYDPRNSFLNDVLDRRVGIPITLGLIYIEVGRRIGLPVEGVAFPGHFLVKCRLRDGAVVLDPYGRGVSLGIEQLRQRLRALPGGGLPAEQAVYGMLSAAGNREILIRMLRNLKAIYVQRQQWEKALRIADRLVCAAPAVAIEYRDRGGIYARLECPHGALQDLQAYLDMATDAKDARVIRSQIDALRMAASRLN